MGSEKKKVGAVGEAAATQLTKEGAKAGAKKLAARAATGAVASSAAKVCDEFRQCAKNEKN